MGAHLAGVSLNPPRPLDLRTALESLKDPTGPPAASWWFIGELREVRFSNRGKHGKVLCPGSISTHRIPMGFGIFNFMNG